VQGRLAAAENIVIHAWQIVMDERVGVDQLDAARQFRYARAVPSCRVIGGHYQQRTYPLAGTQDCVSDGIGDRPGKTAQL
jgi:hypothetical protein